MDDLRTRMRNFLNCYRQDIHTRSQEIVAAWAKARAGLKTDPSTPPPPLPTGQDAGDRFGRRIALSPDCLFIKDETRMKQWRRFHRIVVLINSDVSLRDVAVP